ncbi:hypothetical protein, partial [Pseudomonas sp. 79_C]|uniref:hypothetical protein n=1 Tax=Pseudomonas sp. 79_C TaxID=2813567 RepID=UPI001A9CEF32
MFEPVPPRAFQEWSCRRAGTFRPSLLKVVPGKNRYRQILSSGLSELKAGSAVRLRANTLAERCTMTSTLPDLNLLRIF